MEFLVGVLIVIVLVDLLLTFGVVRRLREHTTRLAELQNGPGGVLPGLRPGDAVPDFPSVSTTAGGTLSPAALRNRTSLVAFHSIGCGACEQDAPALADRLRVEAERGVPAFVVVATQGADGDAEHIRELAETMDGLAGVVGEHPGGPVQQAFDVGGYPTYFVVGHDGRVVSTSPRVSDLPTEAPAVVSAGGHPPNHNS
ncbi:TlpA family protein disulfide reductase [Virgisporangium aurantiacum]|uniref:Thioredoxin domain-containing protein n=1 Tax=Virgisporangium aurantiacum TaxID=175570 RepID=A0A8J4E640_9ACTN|nr:redoxin family protein [Virgisporangium aurantiacum]GIJ63655.1 hypothetical protein Vau01_111710 [Virgisporangium aurantiacum]